MIIEINQIILSVICPICNVRVIAGLPYTIKLIVFSRHLNSPPPFNNNNSIWSQSLFYTPAMDRYHPFLIISSIRRVCSSPSTHPTPSWLQRISPIRPDYRSNKISPPRIARHKNSGYHCKRPPSSFQPLKYFSIIIRRNGLLKI